MDPNRTENIAEALNIGIVVAIFLLNTRRISKGIELLNECLFILNNMHGALGKEGQFFKMMLSCVYGAMLHGYELINDHTSAIECNRRILIQLRECGRRYEEGRATFKLAELYQQQNNYKKAEEFYTNALHITTETRDKETEGACYANLGTLFNSLGKYKKGRGYYHKALKIRFKIGDKRGEAADYGNLGSVFYTLGEYDKAQECFQKNLKIQIDVGDKSGEATAYGNLGTVFQSLGEYERAEECHQKALELRIEIGDKIGEAETHGDLGTVFQAMDKYDKDEEQTQKALKILIEIGDKSGEATAYANLGTTSMCLGEFAKAEKYLQKALKLKIEIGDKGGEAIAYGNLAGAFEAFGEYEKAEKYARKALKILIDIGGNCKSEKAAAYGNLGAVFHSLGEYEKAEECHQKALKIRIETGDRNGEATAYGTLGADFRSLGKYEEAEECFEKALQIRIEIGDKSGQAVDYGNLGTLFHCQGKYEKAEKYTQRALKILIEIGDQHGEATTYGNLGSVYYSLDEYSKAKEYKEKALSLAYKIGDIELQFSTHLDLTMLALILNEDVNEAVSCLIKSIEKSEELRGFLKGNEHFKNCSLDMHVSPYKLLSVLFSCGELFNEALHVIELARTRTLADMMSTRYSVEQGISVNPHSCVGIERIMAKEVASACLYCSYFQTDLLLWLIKRNKPVVFRQKDVNGFISSNGARRNVDEVFSDKSYRTFPPLLNQEQCEDRSMFSSNSGCLSPFRPIEEDQDEGQVPKPPSFTQCYEMIVDPVAHLLTDPEIIIVPEGPLYKLPFAALKDKNGKTLSESFMIRIVPSLTILKLLQDSPTDYHCRTGALIVGEPDVGQVYYKGRVDKLCPLPCAREEAKMIGRLLHVKPLLGENATKQAVLQGIQSVSLIHFAAHGDAERGEIALAPPRPLDGIPQEKDYLLTMAEIAQVRLRAKLVVLSCCHSANGKVRSEGIVGIARAFLGSGARSVLVALWALEDKATMQFMSRFYENLYLGKSASESLHQSMKWMRSNEFSKLEYWAPFVLTGDNVTFDFGEWKGLERDRTEAGEEDF